MIIKSLHDFEKKADFFEYLLENKRAISDFKMSKPRFDNKDGHVSEASKLFKPVNLPPMQIDDSVEKLYIEVVANTSNYIDNHLDMLGKNGAKESLSRIAIIPALHDHQHTLDAQIGKTKKIFYKTLNLRDIGWDEDGTANCLIFAFEALRSLNEFIFKEYYSGNINQHSVGMRYEEIVLCVNSDESWWKDEKQNFDKYYNLAINKERADNYGYFWYVPKWTLIENSPVLFGSNELTPTLSISEVNNSGKKSTKSKTNYYFSAINEFNTLFE